MEAIHLPRRGLHRELELTRGVLQQAHLAVGNPQVVVRFIIALTDGPLDAALKLAEDRREAIVEVAGGAVRSPVVVCKHLGELGGEIKRWLVHWDMRGVVRNLRLRLIFRCRQVWIGVSSLLSLSQRALAIQTWRRKLE